MRLVGIFCSAALLASAVAVGVSPSPPVRADGGCAVGAINGEYAVWSCDAFYPAAGPRGSIAVMGDSVMQGSAPTRSSPSLPEVLAEQGWGPIRMTTGLGMQVHLPGLPNASGDDTARRWYAQGVRPTVVAVNIGAAYSNCTPDSPGCKADIDRLLATVWSLWPNATVWWAKTVQRDPFTGEDKTTMTAWNSALDVAAKQHPGKLVLWDWPAALTGSSMVMDPPSVHPATASGFAERSRMIADHLSTFMPARYVGPRVAVPSPSTSALGFVPQRDPIAGAVPRVTLAAGVERRISLGRFLPTSAARGAVLTLNSAGAARSGWLRVYSCGRSVSRTSVLYFAAGQRGSTQSIVAFSTGTSVCAVSNVDVAVEMAVQGALVADGGTTFTPLAPRIPTVSTTASPAVQRIDDPALAAPGVAAAVAMVTLDGASTGGSLTLHQCGVPASARPTLSITPGGTASTTVYVPVKGGRICMTSSFADTPPRVRVALTGVFTTSRSGARFRFASTGTRLLDLRPTARRGGWYGRQVAYQTIAVATTPQGGVAVVGVVTSYLNRVGGEVLARGKGASGARTPAVAFTAGSKVASGPVTMPTGAARALDLTMRRGNALTAFDVIGWWTK